MKTKLKRIGLAFIACLLALSMLLSFVACSDEEDKKKDEASDEKDEDKNENEDDKGDDTPDLEGPINVTSAEEVAGLINSLWEDTVFDRLDSLAPSGDGDSLNLSDILAVTSNINLLADNFTVNGVKTDLLDMFVIKDNTLYLSGKDEYGFDNSIAGKLTENGYAIIAFSDEYSELLDLQSFAEILGYFENIPKIDVEAIKAALTVKPEDLKMKEAGVWQLKSSYIVDALSEIIDAIGIENALGVEIPPFNALLNISMVADLRELNKNGAVGLELDIPNVVNVKVNVGEDSFKMAITLPEEEVKFTLDFLAAEEENGNSKVTGNLVVKYADVELVKGKLEVVAKEDNNGKSSVTAKFALTAATVKMTVDYSQTEDKNGNVEIKGNLVVKNDNVELVKGDCEILVKRNTENANSSTTADFNLTIGEVKFNADFSYVEAKNGNIETTGDLIVKYDGVEVIKSAFEIFVEENTETAKSSTTAKFSFVAAELEIVANFSSIESKTGNIETTGNISVEYDGMEIADGNFEILVIETGINEVSTTANFYLTIAEMKLDVNFAQVENKNGNVEISGGISIKLAGEDVLKASCELDVTSESDNSTNVEGKLDFEIFYQDEYGYNQSEKITADVDALITDDSVTATLSFAVADAKIVLSLSADSSAIDEKNGNPFIFDCSMYLFDGIEYVLMSSIAAKVETLTAPTDDTVKYNISLSANETTIAFDIAFGGANNFVMPEDEAKTLASYMKLLEKYQDYTKQLEIYADMIEGYIYEGKANQLPETFYIEDKNNPEVGYFFNIYNISSDMPFFDSEINIIPENVSDWCDKFTPVN